MLSHDQIRLTQALHYFTGFRQVAVLFWNQWSVSCSTAFFFFFFFVKRRMCSSLRERASGHDWFSCESQQRPHCSSSSVSGEFAVWRRTFANLCLFPTQALSLSKFEIAPAISDKAFRLNSREQWVPTRLHRGLQVRLSVWEAAVNEPCFFSPLF